MLSKVRVHMKASFLLLRFYLWIVFGVVAINLIVTSIVNLSIGSNDPQISVGNSLTHSRASSYMMGFWGNRYLEITFIVVVY
jgi:hypothetical protein